MPLGAFILQLSQCMLYFDQVHQVSLAHLDHGENLDPLDPLGNEVLPEKGVKQAYQALKVHVVNQVHQEHQVKGENLGHRVRLGFQDLQDLQDLKEKEVTVEHPV